MTRCVVVGAGAREHAIAHALRDVFDVVVTPGNAGIAAHGIACSDEKPEQLQPDLVVIGPEAPLVNGLADSLRARGIPVVGPGSQGARLEGSKAYLKEFLQAAEVPTAAYGIFTDLDEAGRYLADSRPPFVVKTDGLAAGKGVLVTTSLDEARADVAAKLSGDAFGEAGTTVVIEEGLEGVECSLLALCDGEKVVPLVAAQDFKRVGDGGTGPNTGGMGAYAPMNLAAGFVDDIVERFFNPTVTELRRRGIDFRGVLYAGLMLTERGPYLLEYNVRFGDPETEVLAPLYGPGLGELLLGCAHGALGPAPAVMNAAVTVVLASSGYPGGSRSGDLIEGLGPDGQLIEPHEGVTVFHAGTRRRADGRFETNGGRVVAVTGTAPTVAQARERAYRAAALVTFEGRVWRRDIAASTTQGGS